MKYVQPIRDKKSIKIIKTLLKEEYDLKYYLIFVLGINTGLRISDLLHLKVDDLQDKGHLELKEKKTGKHNRLLLNKNLQKEIRDYIETKHLEEGDYLFQSRKGQNQPLMRQTVWRVFHGVCQDIGIDNIGTHSLRKTFGYWHYKTYHNVALLMILFNHSSPSITLRYIGITSDEVDSSLEDFML
ncbi:MAG: site-specific integrase [Eubacterium sp.]|nr:site-specific integrase [Eubacterium sp.]